MYLRLNALEEELYIYILFVRGYPDDNTIYIKTVSNKFGLDLETDISQVERGMCLLVIYTSLLSILKIGGTACK